MDRSILWLRLVAVEFFLRLILQVVIHLLLAVLILQCSASEEQREECSMRREEQGITPSSSW